MTDEQNEYTSVIDMYSSENKLIDENTSNLTSENNLLNDSNSHQNNELSIEENNELHQDIDLTQTQSFDEENLEHLDDTNDSLANEFSEIETNMDKSKQEDKKTNKNLFKKILNMNIKKNLETLPSRLDKILTYLAAAFSFIAAIITIIIILKVFL